MDLLRIPFKLFVFSIVFAALIVISFSGVQAHARPSLADYGALPNVDMMSVSPDGDMVAFRRKTDEHDLLIVLSLEDNKVIQALDVGDMRPQTLYFLDHSRVIIVASDANRRISGFRGTHTISSAFLLDTKSGEITQLLTPGDVIYPGQYGLGRILGISKDGKRLYMPAYVARSRQDRSPDFSLLEVNLESVRRPRVIHRGSNHTIDYFVDREGKVLAEEIFNNRGNFHSIVAYNGTATREIYRQETEVPHISVVGLTPDYTGLIIISDSEELDRDTYYVMSLEDGSLSEPLFDRVDADVHRVFTDINRVTYGVGYSGLSPNYTFFDDKLNEKVNGAVGRFPGHSVWINGISSDHKHIVVRVEGTQYPGDYFLFSDKEEIRFLASSRPEITSDYINPVISYQYQARDGLTIPALLTVPLAHVDNPNHLPTIMMPHGGPEAQDWIGFDWLAQALASQGYLVIQPQFRGSTGFGLQHRLAGRGEWGKKMQDDLTDGLKALIDEKLTDPERVCILGASYGGYAALIGGAFTPDLYQCVVSINGVTDIRRMLRDSRSKYGRHHWVQSYWRGIIASGDVSRRTLNSISPIHFTDDFAAPVLLVHGDQDEIVPYAQSRRMYRRLRRSGKSVELVKLSGEDHFLSYAQTRIESLKAVIGFVDQHIGQRDLVAGD